jgi:hypothetical protein
MGGRQQTPNPGFGETPAVVYTAPLQLHCRPADMPGAGHSMAQLVILPGKDRSLARRHPWIFATAVERLSGRARPGDTVDVVAANGRPLAKAAWSPESKIRARVWTFDPDEVIDDAFFKRRVQAAVERRGMLPELRGQDGLRLIHGESDGLPGVIADRYGDTVVLQLTATGPEKVATGDHLRAASGKRLRTHLRAIGFRRPPTGGARSGHRLGVWRSFARAAGHRRERRAPACRHRCWSQDGFLP